MEIETLIAQIQRRTQKAKKAYLFNDSHPIGEPAQFWFQTSNEGLILFVVFYTLACRWSRCLGCNLPSMVAGRHIPFNAIMAQVDHLFHDPAIIARKTQIRKMIVSNNGSVLDEDTFSSTALMYLLANLNTHLPHLAALTLETRPEYVDLPELEFIARALKEGQTPTALELAIGFEAFDDRIRNDVFDKGLPLDLFERLVRDIAPYGFRLKCYFMQKPVPGMTDAAAVADIHNGIDYLADISSCYKVPISMHLNPTYAARGTLLAEAFDQGAYQPPLLADVARAARHAAGKGVAIFIGLSDEGLAVPGGSFIRPGDAALVERLEGFNQQQDYRLLAAL